MTTYEVSFERKGVYQSNLAIADNKEKVEKWYNKNKPDARIISISIASEDSMKPGKPIITIV